VGVVTYFMDYEAARYLPAPVRDLLHVAVDPAWHGRGIASALVERAMLWASEKNPLHTSRDTNEKLRGERLIREDGFYFGGFAV
jgi:GNAT superfamily N-acetyltransferase